MDIPRELIYEDRFSLEDFGVNDIGTLNNLLYDNYLIETTDLCQGEVNIVNRILKVYNDAYFVCTIVLMQPKAIFGLKYYIDRVDYPQVVFPIVYLYLSKVNSYSIIVSRILKTIKSEIQRMNDWNRNYEYIKKICDLYNGCLNSSIFAPRKLTPDLLSTIKWWDATDCFNKDCIIKVVRDVCRSREDWNMMVKAIKAAAQKYDYDFGFEDYVEEGVDEEGQYLRTIKVPKDPCDIDGNDILEPLKRAGVYQYCDDIMEKYDELSIDATKNNEIKSGDDLQTSISIQPINGGDEEEDELGNKLFFENLNTKKIAETIRTLPKGRLENRKFCMVLYHVFCKINWLSVRINTKFIIWFQKEVGMPFKTKNFKNMKVNDEMIDSFVPYFLEKSPNGGYTDKDFFYKQNKQGYPLKKINNG